jgi:hypothetical protein
VSDSLPFSILNFEGAMNTLRVLYPVLMLFMLSLPALSYLVPLHKSIKLAGEVSNLEPVTLSLDTIMSGSYQSYLEERFKKNAPLWHMLVRTDHEISLQLFGEISHDRSSTLALGGNDTLFERSYINSYNRIREVPEDILISRVRELQELQQRLQALGKKMVVIISPAKTTLYPELIPERALVPNREHRRDLLSSARELLHTHGITTVDGSALFTAAQSESPHKLFAKGGTHWTQYGACLVLEELYRTLDAELKCTVTGVREGPGPSDKDIAKLANVWSIKRFVEPSSPKVAMQIIKPPSQKTLFLEGTSFSWQLRRLINENDAFNLVDFYYYSSRQFLNRERKGKVIPPHLFEWNALIDARDLYVFEINESVIDDVGHASLSQLLAVMRIRVPYIAHQMP